MTGQTPPPKLEAAMHRIEDEVEALALALHAERGEFAVMVMEIKDDVGRPLTVELKLSVTPGTTETPHHVH